MFIGAMTAFMGLDGLCVVSMDFEGLADLCSTLMAFAARPQCHIAALMGFVELHGLHAGSMAFADLDGLCAALMAFAGLVGFHGT